jgi:hypothetical protein
MTAKDDPPLYPHPVVFTLLPWLLFFLSVHGTVRLHCSEEMDMKRIGVIILDSVSLLPALSFPTPPRLSMMSSVHHVAASDLRTP